MTAREAPRGGIWPSSDWRMTVVTVALVVYWLVLFLGTHSPIDPSVVLPGTDKTKHFLGYLGLAFLFGLRLRLNQDRASVSEAKRGRFPFVGAAIVLGLYAAFDELTQPLVGRMMDYKDWFADLGGILVGLTLPLLFRVVSGSPGNVRKAPE